MDKVKRYRQLIKEILYDLATPNIQESVKDYQEYSELVVTDDEHGHYFLFSVGWKDMQRVHGCTVHIDLKGDKIWIQQDWTDVVVVDRFLERDVPQSDIVLAFHAPYKRQYMDFAIG